VRDPSVLPAVLFVSVLLDVLWRVGRSRWVRVRWTPVTATIHEYVTERRAVRVIVTLPAEVGGGRATLTLAPEALGVRSGTDCG